MLEINKLSDIRGNNVTLYAIQTLLDKKMYPKLSIMAGMMGVGKSSVAQVVAGLLDNSGRASKIYNFSMPTDIKKVQEEVFMMSPMTPKAFIFEEIHGLPKDDQGALLQMFDSQKPNIYIICTTTDVHDVLPTIRSRAQVWNFKSLSENQMAALLDDYLDSKGSKMSKESKTALLRSAKGVPRDLIKNADLAIAGEFSDDQLNDLLGNVSDTMSYTIMCSLSSDTADFLMDANHSVSENPYLLYSLRDFWVRYLIERQLRSSSTLEKEMVNSLDTIYSDNQRERIAKMLLKATPSTLLLEMLTLNMSFTGSNASTVVGSQVDKSLAEEREQRKVLNNARTIQLDRNPQISNEFLGGFKI